MKQGSQLFDVDQTIQKPKTKQINEASAYAAASPSHNVKVQLQGQPLEEEMRVKTDNKEESPIRGQKYVKEVTLKNRSSTAVDEWSLSSGQTQQSGLKFSDSINKRSQMKD